ncbi:hypothetical protein ACU6U9_19645 [Pseudomonas sp. HK3]|jgi:hypothetical protein
MNIQSKLLSALSIVIMSLFVSGHAMAAIIVVPMGHPDASPTASACHVGGTVGNGGTYGDLTPFNGSSCTDPNGCCVIEGDQAPPITIITSVSSGYVSEYTRAFEESGSTPQEDNWQYGDEDGLWCNVKDHVKFCQSEAPPCGG